MGVMSQPWAPPTTEPISQPAPPTASTPKPSWWERRPRWQKISAAAVTALILVAAGHATRTTRIDRKAADDALQLLAASRAAGVSQQQQLNADQTTISQLQQTAAAAVAEKQRLDARSAQLDQQQQALTAQKAQLDQRQAQLDASSFGPGLYQVGKDIQPGTYHTTGAANCYWAKLRSSTTSDIIDNSNNDGPQTVVVNSAYFQTENCATWTKIG